MARHPLGRFIRTWTGRALVLNRMELQMKSVAFNTVFLMIGTLTCLESTVAQTDAGKADDSDSLRTTVTVQRDEWGVPHIHGKTHADAIFGMGYVQAEDYFWQLEDTCLRSLGRYAEVAGEAGVSSDILNRSYEIVRRSQDDYSKLGPEYQSMAKAYVDGINRYLRTHPGTKPRRLEHFEPWYVMAMDRHMLLEFIYRRAHVKKPHNRGKNEIASSNNAAPVGQVIANSWELPDQPLSSFAESVQAAIGSNAWAISGTKTSSGSAMLFINPHQPFYGLGQFHEAHVSSDEGLNFSGASFFGSPFPTIGHNEYLGWTYTVNDPDIADAWRVTFDDKSQPLRYRFDGDYREAVQWSETVLVKQDEKFAERQITFRKTHHGPIMKKENDTTFLAVQVAGLFDLNRIIQAWGMVRAKNFDEWRTAFSHCAIPMFNVVYADCAGNIFYAYNGSIPVRNPGLDWTKPVDGSDPRADWKGVHTFDQLPQVLNPQCGYVQSCNSSPFTTTDRESDNPLREKFPSYMIEDRDVDMRRSKMSRLLLGQTTNLEFDQLQNMAYDTSLYWPMTEIPKLDEPLARLRETDSALASEIEPYFAHLKNWDFKSSFDSSQTTLCVAWYEELYGFGYPAETLKRDYAMDRTSWFTALKAAADKIKSLHGGWKVPWGKVHQLQRIPDQPDVENAGIRFSGWNRRLPIAGAPGPLGIIFTVYSTPEIPVIRPQRYAVVGASYMSVVEFSNPIRSQSVMPYGASGNPDSPHFFDQAELYSTKRFKRAWFSRAEVDDHTRNSTTLAR